MEMGGVVIEYTDTEQKRKEPSSAKLSCDWKGAIKRKIPILTWLRGYNTKYLVHDFLAGLTVALTEIPQSIAYAGIAGLPLQYGLYSCFMGGFVYAVFGSCKAINMGSTSIMALLIQPYVNVLGVAASIFTSFVAGFIILVFGLINLGFVIDFFSYPVMSGFTTAAALTIATSQIKNLLGIKGQTEGFLETWRSVFTESDKISKWDTILGLSSLLLLCALKEIGTFANIRNSNLPKKYLLVKHLVFFISVAKNAIVVALGITIAYYLETENLHHLTLTGCVNATFPYFEFPAIANYPTYIKEFNLSLLFIPLVAILETIAVAKVFSKGKTLDASQEMVALGIANIMGAFVQSMPVTGSFTRTAVNNASGAKSNMAAVFTGVAILVAMPFLASTFNYIPKASLAAVIMCAMLYLLDLKAFITIWKSNKLDLIPYLVTLTSSLFVSLEYGILIGTGAHLVLVLYTLARPSVGLQKMALLNFGDVYLIAPSGDVYFPAAQHLRNVAARCDKKDALIIFDGKFISRMDVTVAKSISFLVSEIETRKQKILLLNFGPGIERVCKKIDRKLEKHFKSGGVEDVLIQDRPSARTNDVYSIQF